MHLRNVTLGAMVALVLALLPLGNAQALPPGWSGTCRGADYYAWDGNGNWIIYHNSSRCEA